MEEEHQNRKENMVIKDVPLKYKSSVKKSDLSCIKVVCKSVSRHDVEEEVPKFSGEESNESYLLTMKSIKTLAKRYQWFDVNKCSEGVKWAFETVNRALIDEPLDAWEEVVESLVITRNNTRNETAWNWCVFGLTNQICGDTAADIQLEYMKTLKKPFELTMTE